MYLCKLDRLKIKRSSILVILLGVAISISGCSPFAARDTSDPSKAYMLNFFSHGNHEGSTFVVNIDDRRAATLAPWLELSPGKHEITYLCRVGGESIRLVLSEEFAAGKCYYIRPIGSTHSSIASTPTCSQTMGGAFSAVGGGCSFGGGRPVSYSTCRGELVETNCK